MEVSFTPEEQSQLDLLASNAGRPANDFVREVVTGYLQEVSQISEMLDRRCEEVESGSVKLIPGDEVEAYFAARSAEHRSRK